MEQMSLVIEDMDAAVMEIVRAISGAKKVGPILWPEKSVDQAHRMLLDCLNPDRANRLAPAQVFLLFKLAREAGYHGAKRWLDEALGYVPGEPVEPQDELAKVMRAYTEAVRVQAGLMQRAERLMATAPTLRAVGK